MPRWVSASSCAEHEHVTNKPPGATRLQRRPIEMPIQRAATLQILASPHERRRIEDHDVVRRRWPSTDTPRRPRAPRSPRDRRRCAAHSRASPQRPRSDESTQTTLARAAQRRTNAPAADIAVQVEHARIAIQRREPRPVVCLIEEPAGLLSLREIALRTPRPPSSTSAGRIAAAHVDVRRQTFGGSRAVGVLDDERRRRDERIDRGDDRSRAPLPSPTSRSARRTHRRSDRRRVPAVRRLRRTPTGNTVARYTPLAPAQRAREPLRDQIVVDDRARGSAVAPQSDSPDSRDRSRSTPHRCRRTRIIAPGVTPFSGVARDVDFIRIHPRMTALDATVLSGFELQTVHGRRRVAEVNRLLCRPTSTQDTSRWHPARTGWPMRRARICCSTRTIRSTWYPWSADALTKARDEDKPILLSIGYSACHWCHVMAHESFEDAVDRRDDESSTSSTSKWIAKSGPTSTRCIRPRISC